MPGCSRPVERRPINSSGSRRAETAPILLSSPQKLGRTAIILAGLVAYGAMAALDLSRGTLRAANTPLTLAAYALAFVAFYSAVKHGIRTRWSMRWIWVPAVFFRVLLLVTTPTLSDDVYRYMWDGHVINQGISPYAYAIEDPALDSVAVPVRELANNTWMASPYMPAAQVLFAFLAGVFPLSVTVFQAAMILFDLAAAGLLSVLLRKAGYASQYLLIYLWNPLLIIEVAHGAHLDAAMIMLSALAVVLAFSKHDIYRVIGSPIALALATLTKILPVLLLPVLFWRWCWPQRIIYGTLTLVWLALASRGVGWGLSGDPVGTGVFGALRIYADVWQFNSGLYSWLSIFAARLALMSPDRWAKIIVAAAMVVVAAITAYRAREEIKLLENLRLMILPVGAYLLLTPTVHPWYALLLIVLLPFQARRSGEPFRQSLFLGLGLLLTATLPLSYLTYLDPDNFNELTCVPLVEWLPILVGLLLLARFRK